MFKMSPIGQWRRYLIVDLGWSHAAGLLSLTARQYGLSDTHRDLANRAVGSLVASGLRELPLNHNGGSSSWGGHDISLQPGSHQSWFINGTLCFSNQRLEMRLARKA